MTREVLTTDVLVVGGNPGGCAAAVSAARSGHRVVILEATSTLGGMTANGVCGFDTARPEALSGLAKEVEDRFRAHYARALPDDPLLKRRSDQVFEPHVASRIWSEFVADEPHVTVLCGAVPIAVERGAQGIARVIWRRAVDASGSVEAEGEDREIVASIVIDASYEGDVVAWSGAPHKIGREARRRDEPHAGIIYSNNLEAAPDGTMAQSLLPGSTGAADDAIMAFAFRMVCRLHADPSPAARHRLRTPPPGYDPSRYRWTPTGRDEQGNPTYFNTLYAMVAGKLLLNRMAHGNNLAGLARAYVLAHPVERGALRRAYVDHSLGFLYFIQTDGGMPGLGLAEDEFLDNGHFPRQLYVREGRRIEALVEMNQSHVDPFVAGDGIRPPLRRDSVAIGDWMVESQGCTDETLAGHPYPEGFLFVRASQAPFQVPYGTLLPREVDNLIVCGGLGATHVAFCALRCEAARIQTGIAAGIAAGLAVELGRTPADVPIERIQAEIVRRGGQLTHFADVPIDHPNFPDIQWAALRGIVPPDPDHRFWPDRQVTFADLVEAVVKCLELPISVSGMHFEHIPRSHPTFRYAEALYDLGCRVGVDVFPLDAVRREDPMRDFIRADRTAKRISFRPEDLVSRRHAVGILSRILRAFGRNDAAFREFQLSERGEWLDRGQMCRVIREAAEAV